jgi:hypothetical protein
VKNKACSIDHEDGSIPASVWALPSSQGGKHRHLCAACAYQLGRQHAAETEARLRDRVRALMAEIDQLRAKTK